MLNGVNAAAERVKRRAEPGERAGDAKIVSRSRGGNAGSRRIDRRAAGDAGFGGGIYEEDVQTALGAAMALIEPLILIIMAVFVGGILISLYMPIFTWERTCIKSQVSRLQTFKVSKCESTRLNLETLQP